MGQAAETAGVPLGQRPLLVKGQARHKEGGLQQVGGRDADHTVDAERPQGRDSLQEKVQLEIKLQRFLFDCKVWILTPGPY